MRARFSVVLLLLSGCAEDVGECVGDRGLDTVVVGTKVQYAGQAIINQACATGCHSSSTKGDGRSGAPAGLDFDLLPLNAADAKSATNANGSTYGVLKSSALAGLRDRRRKVVNERGRIWQQVTDGLMPPPGGRFATFRALGSIVDSDSDSPCTRGEPLGEFGDRDAREALRNWLACGAPIVESYGGPAERDGVAGTVGYQYLMCEDTSSGSTLTELMADDGVLVTTTCNVCHPALAADYPLDLTSIDNAYETLVEDQTPKCKGKPYVTPGDPDESFLIDVVSKDDPGCDIRRMPVSGELTEGQIQLLRDWITAGAPK